MNSITGKIIAEKSNYRGAATPITPPLNPPLIDYSFTVI